MKKYTLSLIASLVVSFAFVVIYASGATTISTNINTGGTLTVSGATTLSGNTTLGDSLTGDISLFTSKLHASTTALFTDGAVMYDSLILSTSGDDTTEGGIYYDSTSKVIKLYDGSAWYTIGTSTDGFNLAGTNDFRVQLSDLTNYMTLGTTTQSGLSVMTLEATSTAAIPLTIIADTSQTANLFQVLDDGATELFAIDAYGSASSTGPWTINGDLYNNGWASTTASNGNFATKGTLTAIGNISFDGGTFIFNESSADKDFRVESNGNVNMLLVDGGADRVGVGSSTPLATLSVETSAGDSSFLVGSTTGIYLEIDSNGDLKVDTSDLVVDISTNRVGVATTTPGAMLSVGANAATSTIRTGRLCFSTELPDGTFMYLWPCNGADCGANGTSAWATSSTSCE